MAKLLYICHRNQGRQAERTVDLGAIARRLEPDNITANKAAVYSDCGISYCISNPGTWVSECAGSVALGNIEPGSNWATVGNESIDGSYAIFRASSEFVEIVTDATASRTIWYYFDNVIFIASTSQRAISMVLGGVEKSNGAIVWMLSTGTLGPLDAWDNRVKRLNGASCGRLNRESWTLEVRCDEINFRRNASTIEPKKDLESAINESVARLDLSSEKWILPLSGGYDSRAILIYLLQRSRPKTVTWGLQASADDPKSDVYIAKELANRLDVEHQFLEINKSSESIETVLSRFIRCGEGRIDHISGYIDGFDVWKRLSKSGIEAIIRGDECFGWGDVFSTSDVLSSVGIYRWTDFSNLPPLEKFSLTPVNIPEELLQRNGETIYTWRDRLYQVFRIPVVLAALSDLKLPYVEIANPFLTKRVVQVVRAESDSDRNDKALFRKICERLSPSIPFASHSSIATPEDILKNEQLRQELFNGLSGSNAGKVLNRELISFIFSMFTKGQFGGVVLGNRRLRSIINRFSPSFVSFIVKKNFRTRHMDADQFLFRAYIIIRMYELLHEDAAFTRC